MRLCLIEMEVYVADVVVDGREFRESPRVDMR